MRDKTLTLEKPQEPFFRVRKEHTDLMHHETLTLLQGTVLDGRYELISELGRGGFGVVYKAKQLATEQLVAVKVLHETSYSGSSGTKRIARFHREMQLCGQLHHPNLVRLIDFSQASTECIYAVFEFIPGRTLADVLADEGALEPRETRHLMCQVLDALACAHAANVVHRDLKPSNIMVVPTGARRNAMVLDFGIGALSEGPEIEDLRRLTETNEFIGTPSYAAPEQLRHMPPTTRSDLFTWGLVFLECLTGRRTIAGDSLLEVISSQLGEEPIAIPPALRAHEIGAIIEKTLIKDVDKREITAAGLLQAVDDCTLDGLGRRATLAREAAAVVVPTRVNTFEVIEVAAEPPVPPTVDVCARISPVATTLGAGPSPLTALCCCLNTSSEGADLEGIDTLLRSRLQLCIDVARSFRGHVASVFGDCALFYFGYPDAGVDDAERAAHAALAIATAVAGAGPVTSGPKAVSSVEVRLGLDSGTVTVCAPGAAGHSDVGPITGLPPRIALYLALAAPLGAILVSAGGRRALGDHVTLERAGIHQIQGIPRTGEIFTLLPAQGGRIGHD